MMLHVSHGGASDSPDMRNFQPRRVSSDDAHLKEKDKLDARTIATTRDWPMLARANRRKRDEIIGGGDSYRMECRPVWRALPEPFTQKYAEEWGRQVSIMGNDTIQLEVTWKPLPKPSFNSKRKRHRERYQGSVLQVDRVFPFPRGS